MKRVWGGEGRGGVNKDILRSQCAGNSASEESNEGRKHVEAEQSDSAPAVIDGFVLLEPRRAA